MLLRKEKDKNQQRKSSSLSRFGIGKEKDYFIENFALLLSSGIDVVSAVDSIRQEIKAAAMKAIIDDFKEDLEAGVSLSDALENTRIFPDFVFSLIRIGEKSGKLPENLQLIVNQQKKDRTFRSKIKMAIMYPAFVMFLAMVLGIGISWFILPKLATIFFQLKLNLPLITKILIKFGVFMGKNGKIVAPIFLAVISAVFYFIFIFPKTKFLGQKLLFSVPGIRRLLQEVELARLGFVLGILLEAGVPILESIKAVGSSASLFEYRKLYFFLADKVDEGYTISQGFSLYPKSRILIPGSAMQIISAGEKSGKLSEALRRVGDIYEEKTENTTKYLATMLEPILLITVWLGVVFVALAVIMPIYSLVGGFSANQNSSSAPPPPPVPIEESAPFESDGEQDAEDGLSAGEAALENTEAAGDNVQTILTATILPTETGFLNVRESASKQSAVIGKVLPGETYEVRQEIEGWYEIELADGKLGWILGEYAEVSETPVLQDSAATGSSTSDMQETETQGDAGQESESPADDEQETGQTAKEETASQTETGPEEGENAQ